MKGNFNLDPNCCSEKKELNKNQEKQKKAKDNEVKNVSSLTLFILLFFVASLFVFGGTLLAYKIYNGWINNPIPGNPPEKENIGGAQKFKDYEEMKEFMEKNAISSAYGYGNYLGGVNTFEKRMDVNMEAMPDAGIEGWGTAEAPAGMPNGMGGGESYSTTNIQVAGVDEGDIIKTDGKYIYTVSGNEVVIVDAYPASDAKEVSRIKLDSSPNGIYLNGDKLAVYGQNYNIYNAKDYENILPRRNSSYSFLKIYDISDRSNPKQTRSFDFEGQLVNSRMIGDYVYAVTSSYNYYVYDDKFPVPVMLENGKVLSSDKTAANCNCPDIYYFDIPYHSYNFTAVSSLNMKNDAEKINSEVYLLDGQQNSMFVSMGNIYITFNKQVSEEELLMDITMDMLKEYIFPEMNEKDKAIIDKIEKTDNEVLSPMEKYQKIIMLMEKYQNIFKDREDELQQEMEKRAKQKYDDISKELEKTVIHKIEIKDGKLKYKTFGEVTGIVLNQFSMDENSGYFRIATTRSRDWSRFNNDNSQSYSNIYVLDEDMKVIGKVEELAEGEQIYSVRFMQNRAYMVTFKRTDPLFVVDLSSPSNPQVLGELKVPGFSSYLHPYDNMTLIGLGKESDENGRIIGGVKLSLFDVADVENPKELDKYVIGDSSSDSIAINEHKAFLFSKDKNLLVIPVTTSNISPILNEGISFEQQEMMMLSPKSMPPAYQKSFNGAFVFSIDETRFNLRGIIDHSEELPFDVAKMFVQGKFENGLKLNGINEYVQIMNLDELSGSEEATFGYWVKYDQLASNHYQLSGYISSESNAIRLGQYGGNKLFVNAGRHQDSTSDYKFETGKWYHLVLTMKAGDKWRAYINGEIVADGTIGLVSSEFSSIPYLAFGGTFEYSAMKIKYPINGMIDDVRIYNRALSASEVKSAYSGETSNSGLVVHWKFDGSDSANIADSSGSGNIGAVEHIDQSYMSTDYYQKQVKRSLYIKDILYTLSNKYLKANRIEDLADVKKIDLPGYDSYSVPMMETWR